MITLLVNWFPGRADASKKAVDAKKRWIDRRIGQFGRNAICRNEGLPPKGTLLLDSGVLTKGKLLK